jgi:molybdopterin molybdotransferase
MGRADHIPAVLAELGVKRVFHKVRQKPGKPFWFGMAPGNRPVFALPGNPASVLVCLHRYVLPGLREAMGGAPEPALRAVLEEAAPAPGTLTQFRPVTVRPRQDGVLAAAFVSNQGSGDFSGWSRCDGFVELAAGESLPAGSAVPVHLW